MCVYGGGSVRVGVAGTVQEQDYVEGGQDDIESELHRGETGGKKSGGMAPRQGRVGVGGSLRKGELDGETEGTREPEMEAGEGVGVLIALKRSGLFVCLPLL